jgi:hypothetical protein
MLEDPAYQRRPLAENAHDAAKMPACHALNRLAKLGDTSEIARRPNADALHRDERSAQGGSGKPVRTGGSEI